MKTTTVADTHKTHVIASRLEYVAEAIDLLHRYGAADVRTSMPQMRDGSLASVVAIDVARSAVYHLAQALTRRGSERQRLATIGIRQYNALLETVGVVRQWRAVA